MWEMWKELKFAVNWNAGDTKPIRQGRSSRWINITTTTTTATTTTRKTTTIIMQTSQSSRSRSRSMLSKSNAESLNKFGLIGVAEPDQKSAKSRKVQIFKYYHLQYDRLELE